MAQLVVPAGVQVRLRWQKDASVDSFNMFGAHNPTAVVISQALANTVGAAIKSSLGTSGLGPLLSPNMRLMGVGLRDVNLPNRPMFEDAGAAVAGTGTGDSLPRQIAMCVTLRTALAGKSYRGRVYLSGFTEGSNDPDGNIASATVTAALAFVNSIISTLNTNNIPMAILSRPIDATPEIVIPAKPGRAAFLTPVTTAISRTGQWETQRRRVNQ